MRRHIPKAGAVCKECGKPPGFCVCNRKAPSRAVKLDKDGFPVRAEDWLLEDWRDLWNGITKIKAKILRARHRMS